METDHNILSNTTPDFSFSYSATTRDVNYSCGSCGYELNLNSCNRNTSAIDAKYEKSIKKGTFSFYSIDESRFTQSEILRYMPYYTSIRCWGLFQRRTKLFCFKCGKHIGNAYKLQDSSPTMRSSSKLYSISWDGICNDRIYEIKLRALQPSSSSSAEDFSTAVTV